MRQLTCILGIAVCGFSSLIGCSGQNSEVPAETKQQVEAVDTESAQADKADTEQDGPTPTEPAEPAASSAKLADMSVGGNPSTISDPEENLKGDPERRYMDILESSVRVEGDRCILSVVTAEPFPDASAMTGKRFDFIWFIDIDRNRETGQSWRGNDYNVHLFLGAKGWHASFARVSEVSKRHSVSIDRAQFEKNATGNTASLSFPAEYLPAQSFDWWLWCTTTNSDWPPKTENPVTERGTFSMTDGAQ